MAAAQSAAAPQPQSPSRSPPMAQQLPPAAALEAAIAALPAKKAALREAFDHLAGCSPYPLPFTWEQLDAHISSIQSSVSRRFGQLRVLEAARPAQAVSAPTETRGDEKGVDQGEEEEEEVEPEEVEDEEEPSEEEVEEFVDEEDIEEEVEVEVEEVVEDVEVEEVVEEVEVEEVMEEVEVDEEVKEEANEEIQDANDRIGTKTRDEEEEQEGQEAEEEQEVVEYEKVEDPEKMARKHLNRAPPGTTKDLEVACANMDATMLARFVCFNSPAPQTYLPIAMRCAPDAAVLVLRVAKLFLSNKKFMSIKVWSKFVRLIRCVPAAAAKPSADTVEEAKHVAKDWKDMVDKPRTYGEHGVLASWGFLHFLISYNIVSEFDTDEIIHLVGTVPRKQLKINTMELCKGLGLAGRITVLIDFFIGNGQQLDAIHLAHVFNLLDKYPPLSLLKGYLEKAKQTVMATFGKDMTRKSQNLAIVKEVDNLRVAQNIVKQHITDSRQCSVVLAEIKNLLDEYGRKKEGFLSKRKNEVFLSKKKEGLAHASTPATSKSQQQQKQSNKKRKKEMQEQEQEQNRGQESQKKWQRSKPVQKLEQ